MGNIIKPEDIVAIDAMSAEDISSMSVEVLKADRELTSVTNEMENLSECIKQLSFTKAKYDEKADELRRRMRNMISRL